MSTTFHRGYCLQSSAGSNVWHVRIRKQVLSGSLPAVKKSVDWWCDTSTVIEPNEFESLISSKEGEHVGEQSEYSGYLIKNDTGAKNGWYCFYDGKLVKGSKQAIEKYIDHTQRKNDMSLVYSTEVGRIEPKEEVAQPPKGDGIVRIQHQTKGRKGKGVCVITGLNVDNDSLRALAVELKKVCGSGGAVKDWTIEIQGDNRDKIKALLEQKGYTVKLSGG